MCKRFIEDLTNKIIEKQCLENLSLSELKEINKKCQMIIDKRKKILMDELVRAFMFENYHMTYLYKGIWIQLLPHFKEIYAFSFSPKMGNEDMNFKPYTLIVNEEKLSFLTKEELLNYFIPIIDIKEKKQFYDICLQKINLLEDLFNNY